MVEGVVSAFFVILAFIAGVLLGLFFKGRLCLLVMLAASLSACAAPPRYICRPALAQIDGQVPVALCDPVRPP